MADSQKVPTAIGTPLTQKRVVGNAKIIIGKPPVILQTQPYGYVRLETPEQLKQWEEDVRTFYGLSLDTSNMAGQACETCSYGCTDDCGLLEE